MHLLFKLWLEILNDKQQARFEHLPHSIQHEYVVVLTLMYSSCS